MDRPERTAEPEYPKITREYYKKQGICPKCKKNPRFGNFIHCADCLEKISLDNLKYKEKRKEYDERHNEKKKIKYRERKSSGLCTRCGKNPQQHGLLCNKCWAKVQSLRKRREYPKRSRYGEAFRSRIEAGVCMYCGKEVLQGYKLCKECIEKRREALKCSNIAEKSPWRKEVEAQWENAKRMHSENG